MAEVEKVEKVEKTKKEKKSKSGKSDKIDRQESESSLKKAKKNKPKVAKFTTTASFLNLEETPTLTTTSADYPTMSTQVETSPKALEARTKSMQWGAEDEFQMRRTVPVIKHDLDPKSKVAKELSRKRTEPSPRLSINGIAHAMRYRFAQQLKIPKFAPDSICETMQMVVLYQDEDMEVEIDRIPTGCVLKIMEQQPDRKEVCLVQYWILVGFINIVNEERQLTVFPQVKHPLLIDFAALPKKLSITKEEQHVLDDSIAKYEVTEYEILDALFPITIHEKCDEQAAVIEKLPAGSKVVVLKIVGAQRHVMVRGLKKNAKIGWTACVTKQGKPMLGHRLSKFPMCYIEQRAPLITTKVLEPAVSSDHKAAKANWIVPKGGQVMVEHFGGFSSTGAPRALIVYEDPTTGVEHEGWVKIAEKDGSPILTLAAPDKTTTEVKNWLMSLMRNDISKWETKRGKKGEIAIPTLNDMDAYNRTGLIYAIAHGHLDAVRYLIKRKDVSIRTVDIFNRNALHYAAKRMMGAPQARDDMPYLIICRMLVNLRVKVNLQDNDGWTPLMYAIQGGHDQVSKCLVQLKADVNIRNDDGESALMMAEQDAERGGTLFRWLQRDDELNAKDLIIPHPTNSEQLAIAKYQAQETENLKYRTDFTTIYTHHDATL